MAVKQLPARVDVECVAGDPFTVTFTASSGVTTFSSPAAVMTTAGGDSYSTDPGVPTASASGASLSTAWSAADTAALNTTTKPKVYKWSTKAVADGGSSFQWYGGTITVHPVGTAGVSTSAAVTAAVTVGGVSVDATVIAGTGAAGSVTVTDLAEFYAGSTVEAVLAELPSRFTPSRFDVRDYGAELDGSTDDSAAFAAAIAAMRSAGRGTVYVPAGVMALASTVKFPADTRVMWDDVRIESSVANAPVLWITGSNVEMSGRVVVDCNSATAATGLRVQGTTDFSGSGSATHCNLSCADITVIAATERSFDISSNPAVGNTILNHFGNMRSYQGTGVGLELRTTSGTAGWTNANHFEWMSIQSHTSGTPLRVDYADSNHFDWLEIENCTGSGIFAIDLVNCFGFYVDGGWLEGNTGNIRIANNPAVLAVYIDAHVDSSLQAADTKFSHTLSTNRSIVLRNKQDAREYGQSRHSRLAVGVDGNAANDQSVRPLSVSGGIECYRYSSGTGLFYFKGQAAGMGYFFDDGTTGILEMNTTRIQAQGSTRIETGAGGVLRTGRNATGSRPSATAQGVGSIFFDTTLNKPVFSDGTNWRDAAGTIV